MKTPDVIQGIKILQDYRNKPDGWHLGADHDEIYAFATDKPLLASDLKRMIELGWFQHQVKVEKGCNFGAENYDPSEGWCARL